MSTATELVVVGVDGGGTTTRVHVADEHGKLLGKLEGEGTAVRPGHEHEVAERVAAMVREALIQCDMGHLLPRSLVVALAGAGREAVRTALDNEFVRLEVADTTLVTTDAEAALADAFGSDGAGILLIAGTGSVAWGRSPAGTMQRCGGHGFVIGDEGSGAWLGRRALQVICAAHDGREPQTAITGGVLTMLEFDDVSQLIPWAAEATPAQFATLAPAVMAAAESGDLRANTVVTTAVEELALHVRALARQLFADERAAVPVALHGGLMGRGSPLRKRLEHRLKSLVPGAQVRTQAVDGARGAVALALRSIGLAAEAS